MAFELMNLVSPYNYTRNLVHLNKNDILDQPAFDKMELSAKYWLDLRHCYRYGKKNPQQLFEIFGYFNSEEPEDVQSNICTRIKMEMELYAKVGTVHLLFIDSDIAKWLKAMKNNRNYGDPLMLYTLSRTFQRHSVVLCANRAWSTVGTDDPIDSDRLLEICHVKLVYIGHNMFGELREKSVLPVSSYPAIKDTTCVTVLATNKTIADINVCLKPPTVDEEDPVLDTHDYDDSPELSVLDDYSEDTIIYPLPVNSDNMLESPLLNINNTTNSPIGTGYYTRLDENSERDLERDYKVQITDSSPDNIAACVNTENDHNVQGTIDSSVSDLNKMQENIVSGINVTDDHNYATKGINGEDLTGKNKDVDIEFSDVNG